MNKTAVFSASAFILMLSLGGVQAEPKGDMRQGAEAGSGAGPSAADSSPTMKAPDAPLAVRSKADGPNAGASDLKPDSSQQPDKGKAAGRKHDNSANSADQKAAKKEASGDGDGVSDDTDAPTEKAAKKENSRDADRMSEDKDASTVKGAEDSEADGKSLMEGSSKSHANETDSSRKSSKSVKLEPQQVEKTRTYFREHRPSIKSVDRSQVSVSIGLALPGTITLYDLPPDVIVVSGACPIRYFLWGNDLVLVDSCTREVVEIIDGVA